MSENVKPKVYVIGSLRSDRASSLANYLREWIAGVEFFDDWQAAGPGADDSWRDYERTRGRTFKEALAGHAAKHVFGFDKAHLDSSDACILCLPAGKSAHLEAGYMIGKGVPTYIFLDDTVDRWDVMYQFANDFDSDPGEVVRWVSETLGTPCEYPHDAI
jgi:hypothetical protein